MDFPRKSMSQLPWPVYVPSPSKITSPSVDPSIAAWIVGKSPLPSGYTTYSAARLGVDRTKRNTTGLVFGDSVPNLMMPTSQLHTAVAR
jgi:hypothetical protein